MNRRASVWEDTVIGCTKLNSAAWSVAQDVFDGAAQGGLSFATFNGHQGVKRLLPPPPPEVHLFSRQFDFASDVRIERSAECP
jgi:hypothetical protein